MTLPTDAELVLAAQATYDPAATPAIQALQSSIRIFVTKIPSGNTISVEGTHDIAGWLEDFLAIEVSGNGHPGANHPTLGWVHAGFLLDAEEVLPAVREVAQDGPYSIAGHSLGAAEALMLGALLTVEGLPPIKIGAFAPPRVGGIDFANVIKSLPLCAYRFGKDIVPEVPFTLAAFPYIQVPLIEVGVDSTLDRFAAHNIANYVAAVQALFPAL
jgi:Lipase (class 3)